MEKFKKRFVWLNPVAEKIVDRDYNDLLKQIEAKGYIVVESNNQADIIRNAYKDYIEGTKSKPIIDARCPAVVECIKRNYPEAIGHIAPIPPILIACAHELYEKYIKKGTEFTTLTIVTPCTELVDYGKGIFSKNVEFVTWREFKRIIDYKIVHKRLSSSPIPLGFFDGLPIKVKKASGEEGIEQVIKSIASNSISNHTELCELLLCQNGCHNGDGV
ncbi:MAG: hypothetical protein JJT76_09095 [Clostridiaceae bacterium]|nr:hypothetical protein [Clostridiaceae bacterium]